MIPLMHQYASFCKIIYSFSIFPCLRGYRGNSCQSKCQYPRFGENCRQTCHCQLPFCNHIYGCMRPGYNTQYRRYALWLKYILYEHETLKKNVNNSMIILLYLNGRQQIVLFVAEKCALGHTGINCQQPCSYPFYGSGCQQVCLFPTKRCDISEGCKSVENSKYLYFFRTSAI